MAKIFISVLGISPYLECYYHIDDQPYGPTRFVQEATLAHTCRSWAPEDRILILTTAESHAKNWVDSGQSREPYPGLESVIRGMGIPPALKEISIPEGANEGEIWKIFELLFGLLQEFYEVTF